MGHLPGAAPTTSVPWSPVPRCSAVPDPQQTWAGTRHTPTPCCQASVDSTPSAAQGPTLASPASPEAGSECPMFDLVDPISRGSRRAAHRARSMPFSSWGSPTWKGHRRVRTAVEQPRCGLWAGPHLGACAVGFDVLQGLGRHSKRLVQGAQELLLGLSRREGDT